MCTIVCEYNRPPSGAAKPNTECSQQFPTLGVSASTPAEKAPGVGSYLQSGSFNNSSSSSSSPMKGSLSESSSMSTPGGRPRLALQARTTPLPPAPPVSTENTPTTTTTPISPVNKEEMKNVESPSSDARPISRADSVSSWRGGNTSVPSGERALPERSERNESRSEPTWQREKREELPISDRDTLPRDSPADSVSSWRGQPTSLPKSNSMRSPDREASSSWRERQAPSSSDAAGPSWRGASAGSAAQTSPGSSGIKFGGSGGGGRPKLALKPRSVREPEASN